VVRRAGSPHRGSRVACLLQRDKHSLCTLTQREPTRPNPPRFPISIPLGASAVPVAAGVCGGPYRAMLRCVADDDCGRLRQRALDGALVDRVGADAYHSGAAERLRVARDDACGELRLGYWQLGICARIRMGAGIQSLPAQRRDWRACVPTVWYVDQLWRSGRGSIVLGQRGPIRRCGVRRHRRGAARHDCSRPPPCRTRRRFIGLDWVRRVAFSLCLAIFRLVATEASVDLELRATTRCAARSPSISC
jgi:hypothetical protein